MEKLVEESVKMSRFKHPHVMGLIGVCLDAGPAPYIVMPYMANGCLLDYLKKKRANLVLTINDEDDEVRVTCKMKQFLCTFYTVMYTQCICILWYIGGGSSKATDDDVSPDS